MTISRSLHVAANGIISLFFYDWVLFHCIYVPHLLYPFLCGWTLRLSSLFCGLQHWPWQLPCGRWPQRFKDRVGDASLFPVGAEPPPAPVSPLSSPWPWLMLKFLSLVSDSYWRGIPGNSRPTFVSSKSKGKLYPLIRAWKGGSRALEHRFSLTGRGRGCFPGISSVGRGGRSSRGASRGWSSVSAHGPPPPSWIECAARLLHTVPSWGVGTAVSRWERWPEGPGVRPLHATSCEQVKVNWAPREKEGKTLLYYPHAPGTASGLCPWKVPPVTFSGPSFLRVEGPSSELLPADFGVLTAGTGAELPSSCL